ncbi:porin family protein [Spirosoma aerophilum]
MHKRFYLWAPLLVLAQLLVLPSRAQLVADVETGAVTGTAYNDVRIPNTGGTLVNLAKELTIKPKIFYRLRLSYTLAKRHTISALYAPLTVRYDGNFDQPVNFNNTVFTPEQPVTAFYQFNSYRLTYRYDIVARQRWRVGLGLTAKIRDANVRIVNDAAKQDTNFDNVGFVPLVNLYVAYQATDRWRFIVEGDALGSKFGRAEDIFAGAAYQFSKTLGVKGGYRVVEGGADVDTIYNFTWINYASVGLLATF